MAQVHGNAQLVHPPDCIPPEGRESPGARLHDSRGERRLAVVRQLHHTHAEIAEQLERIEPPAEHLGALEGENDS